MGRFVQLFWGMALRRKGPADLPASQFLLGLTLAAYILAQLPIVVPSYGWSARLLGIVLLDVLTVALFVGAVLIASGCRQRYVQTITAWFGVGTVLALFAVPFNAWWQGVSEAAAPSIVPLLALLMVVVWSITVNAHILAQAISRPFGIGLLIALAYFFLSFGVMGLLPPEI
jgi:hypothetical protein